jgi:hypothetical protein
MAGSSPPAGQIPQESEALRLAGVRSNNPFANADHNASEGHENAPESPSSPGAGSTEFHDARSIHLATSPSNAPGDGASPIAASPSSSAHSEIGPLGNESQSTVPQPLRQDNDLTRVQTETKPWGNQGTGPGVFSNVDPFHASSRNGGDEDTKTEDSKSDGASGNSYARGNGSIAFGETEKIDHSLTHSSHHVWDKIKSTGHHAKEKFHLQDVKSTGPLKSFNPTNVRMRVRFGDDPTDSSRDVGILWRSRDNRKGRNSIIVPRTSLAYPNLPPKNQPVYSASLRGVGRNLYRMAFTFPYWDMAFWSGWSYTWGSVLFVIDGTWAWIPFGWDVDLGGISEYGVGILFFIGALLYQLGAVMAYLEAVNEGSFHGSAMKRFLDGHETDQKKLLDEKIHHFFGHFNPLHTKKHREAEQAEEQALASVDPEAGWKAIHRHERPGSVYPAEKGPAPRRGGVDLGEEEEGESHAYMTWRWWPTWHALKNHHAYEIGYIACSIQLFGATLYSMCGLVALPPVFSALDTKSEYGAYWFPEVLGSCCFLTASFLFLVETQETWWKIQPNVMGWWIGFWAMIGSWGFL